MATLSRIMLKISSFVAAIALVLTLSSAWLMYIPYVNIVGCCAPEILWRSLVSMFFWWVLTKIFRKEKKEETVEAD